MQLIKLALISIIIFVVFITGISFLFPSNVRISKAIDIGASPNTILMYVRDTSQWSLWHPAFEEERRQYLSRVHKKSDSDSMVLFEIENPGRNPAVNGFLTMPSGLSDTTVLQWYMDFKLRWYPWEKFSSLILENSYGAQMQMGLKELKSLSETSHSSKD